LLKKACIVWRSADKIRDVTVTRTVSSAHRPGLGETGGRSKGKEKGGGDVGEERRRRAKKGEGKKVIQTIEC